MKGIHAARNVLKCGLDVCLNRSIFSACLTVASCLVWGVFGEAHAGVQAAGEYQVKAVFVQNFARFVDWPTDTFTDARSPFAICVLGRDPFNDELELAIKGRTVNSRPFVVKRPVRIQEARSCQIVFVSASERKHFDAILGGLNFAGVLTVGDTDGFIQSGGIINFVLEDGRVRCEVNAEAAARANLKISSKLLGVSRIVTVRGEE
jgi:hypothetical protein